MTPLVLAAGATAVLIVVVIWEWMSLGRRSAQAHPAAWPGTIGPASPRIGLARTGGPQIVIDRIPYFVARILIPSMSFGPGLERVLHFAGR